MLKFLFVLSFIGSVIASSVWGISQAFDLTEFFFVFGILSFSMGITLGVMYSVNKAQSKWSDWRLARKERKLAKAEAKAAKAKPEAE